MIWGAVVDSAIVVVALIWMNSHHNRIDDLRRDVDKLQRRVANMDGHLDGAMMPPGGY